MGECTVGVMDGTEDRNTAELVDRAAGGDDAAVNELLEQFLPSVRSYLRVRAGRMLLEKESVSDLAQSVCRSVLENASSFRHGEEDGFRRWLFKTAERKVLDRHAYYTADKRTAAEGERGPGADLDLGALGREGQVTPSRDAIGREELVRLEGAIETLPEDMREVVILSKIVGLTRKGIADELGKTEGAVRMMLHRALAQLADAMSND